MSFGGEANPAAAPLLGGPAAPLRRWRSLALQAFVVLAIALTFAYLARNMLLNMERLNVHAGFAFLARPAGFDISQHLIPYGGGSTYLTAFLVALINTLVLAALAILLTTPLGFAIGLARLSRNRLLAGVAGAYVDIVRNVPFLLQLFFWYFAVLGTLPLPRQSLDLFGLFYLNKRGLHVPAPEAGPGFWPVLALLLLGLALALWPARRAWRAHSRLVGSYWGLAAACLLLPPLLGWLAAGPPLAWDLPVLAGFNFSGGLVLIPEFVAMVVALTLYNAAFIAELVRGGVLSVPKGLVEAGRALGLAPHRVNAKIVVPLALRVILPPLGGQYIQLLKSSSLGAAIAYPELMQVFAGTTLNQTGQPIEIMAVTMATYLLLCLAIAGCINALNRRVQLVER
jgi:general L-amino acid transport system permease protein